MAELELGDARLNRRAEKVLGAMSAAPGASLPRACGSHSDLTGAYRLFDNAAASLPQMLSGHRAATLARAAAESVVLAVQDSTWLDYTTLRSCRGLGPHSHRGERGMLAHASVLVSGEGSVLGTLAVPTLLHGLTGERTHRRDRPAHLRKSYRWVQAHAEAMAMAQTQPHVTWLSVQDREGDLYGLFALARPANGNWLVRSRHDRATRLTAADPVQRMRAQVAAAPIIGTMQVEVTARAGRPARTATVQVRVTSVQLQPPRQSKAQRAGAGALAPVAATLVWARELEAPAGAAPLDWLLVTSVPVGDWAAAQQVIQWYRCRWRIEEFFRVLKSETAVEDLQLCTRQRLEAALGLHLILTWRICALRDQARAQPDHSCEPYFTPPEWHALCLLVNDVIPPQPPSLGEAVVLLARLGGYLDRTSDGPPGHRTIARGLRTLQAALRLAEKINPAWGPKDV